MPCTIRELAKHGGIVSASQPAGPYFRFAWCAGTLHGRSVASHPLWPLQAVSYPLLAPMGEVMGSSSYSHAAVMIHSVKGSCHSLWCPVGDPQKVAGRIEDPEVCQAPCAVLEIFFQWPSCCYDPVALSRNVVYLQYQFHADGRPPAGRGRRKWPRSGPDMDRTTRQRDIRIPPAALIFCDAEAQDPSVKVNDDIEILREDLTPQRHDHLRNNLFAGVQASRWRSRQAAAMVSTIA